MVKKDYSNLMGEEQVKGLDYSSRLELERNYKDLIEINQSLNRQLVSFQANIRNPKFLNLSVPD